MGLYHFDKAFTERTMQDYMDVISKIKQADDKPLLTNLSLIKNPNFLIKVGSCNYAFGFIENSSVKQQKQT